MPTISEILLLEAPIEIVDVGANPIDGAPPYASLLNLGLGKVTGFEPQPEALAALLEKKGPLETYLPYALGNGSPINLNICVASGMTSGLMPDGNTLELFDRLNRLSEIVATEKIETKRLDDISEITKIDFLKIDVQGMELEIIKNGLKKLEYCSIIQIEVSFLPLYIDQPTFGEVDTFFRQNGFVPHCFSSIKTWPISPCVVNGNDSTPLNQLLEADIVYVRDFRRESVITDNQLKSIAIISHTCYGSLDLSMRCIKILQDRGVIGPNSLQDYIESFNS